MNEPNTAEFNPDAVDPNDQEYVESFIQAEEEDKKNVPVPEGTLSADEQQALDKKINETINENTTTDAPKTDAPKTDAPKTDAPKTDAPKTDVTTATTDENKSPDQNGGRRKTHKKRGRCNKKKTIRKKRKSKKGKTNKNKKRRNKRKSKKRS